MKKNKSSEYFCLANSFINLILMFRKDFSLSYIDLFKTNFSKVLCLKLRQKRDYIYCLIIKFEEN